MSSGIPERFVTAAFDAFPANVAVLDERGNIIATNRAWRNFSEENGGGSQLGLSYLGVCGSATGDDSGDAELVAQGICDVLSGERASFEHEYPCHSPTEERYFSVRIAPFTQDGNLFVIVAHHNITARKQAEMAVAKLNEDLEARVRDRTQELEDAQVLLADQNKKLESKNRELVHFAALASHDLQEPLRIIGLYVDALRQRLTPTLDLRSIKQLDVVQEQVERSRNQIREVLRWADVGDSPVLERVDMQELWDRLVGSLDIPPGGELKRSLLPPVMGQRDQIDQLLTNLLSNSIKFRSASPLLISISASRVKDEVHFVLRDNGLGLPESHHSQAFTMLSRPRLHKGVKGSGMGLAICRRIVEGHGGKIWLSSPTESTTGEAGLEVHFRFQAA